MKKALFGIIALSAVTLANSNPGTATEASVPVLVKAEILEPSDSLQITDLAGTLLPQIELDHGRIVKGTTTNSSIVFQDFKVIRGDGNGGLATLGGAEGATTAATIAVGIDSIKTNLLNKTTGEAAGKLESNLSLLGGKDGAVEGITGTTEHGYKINLAKGATEHRGRIYSEITPAQINAVETKTGVYDNGSEVTMKVVYSPATSASAK